MEKLKEYRYEHKFVISAEVAEKISRQLSLLMDLDSHSISQDISYHIRSLYFDDLYNSAYYEKTDGVEIRKKYRIRIYNGDDSLIRLECKHKDADMTYKEDCILTKEQTELILERRFEEVRTENAFLKRFLAEARLKDLRPSVIVDYSRLAYTYPLSEVRITFDMDLKSGRYRTDLFDDDIPAIPIYPENTMVMEVKCNEYIPAHILAVLNSYPKIRQAVSKFALCSEIK
jgi:hypothetical protein